MNRIWSLLIIVLVFVGGCGNVDTDSTESSSSAIEAETTLMEEETANVMQEVEETFDTYEEDRMQPWEPVIMSGGYSQARSIENREPGMYDDYENLIERISEAFTEGKIEEVLQDMEWPVVSLTETEKEQLIQDETYGRLEELVKYPVYTNMVNEEWYLIEQTDKRKDVVIRQMDEESGWCIYDTFKCDVEENGKLWAHRGLSTVASSGDHLFIEYNGLKYLCMIEKNGAGQIEGVAIPIYEFRDFIGEILYIEYTDEVKVETYGLIDGYIGDPLPRYLLEKQ